MPQEFWYPVTIAGHDLPAGMDNSTNVGGANKNESTRPGGGRAGPMTHDDDTSYVSNGTNNSPQAFNIDWPGPMGSYAGVLTAGCRYKSVQGGAGLDGATLGFKFANSAGTTGGQYISGADSAVYLTSGPNDVSDAATYRPGGGSWSAIDFANDQTIFPRYDLTGLVDDSNRVTSVWGEIGYNPPSGGFAFLLNLAGLGALPFVGHFADIAQFRSYLAWRRRFHPRHTKMTPEEIVRAWYEIRAYRHPIFFLPRLA